MTSATPATPGEWADIADTDGWQAHRDGRPDLRDTHWRYRDILRSLTPALEGTNHDDR